MHNNSWKLYIIFNQQFTYVGVTNNIDKRLLKHNKFLPGGAKYTNSKSPNWKYCCYITGFKDKSQSMQLEWAVKHCNPKNTHGIKSRISKLFTILNKSYWTSNSDHSSNINLDIYWLNYHNLAKTIANNYKIDNIKQIYIND